MVRLLQGWRLPDYGSTHPRKLLERCQEPGGHLRNVDWGAINFSEPIQVADVLFVGMGRDDFCDFRLHLPNVPNERTPHLGEAGSVAVPSEMKTGNRSPNNSGTGCGG